MSEHDNTNRGVIWGNKRKEKDTHPDFTGQINVDGVDYWLNGWKRKEGASPNAPSMSFSVRKKDEQSGGGETPRLESDLDDEIPFVTSWPVGNIG